jgi:hypothetical protein
VRCAKKRSKPQKKKKEVRYKKMAVEIVAKNDGGTKLVSKKNSPCSQVKGTKKRSKIHRNRSKIYREARVIKNTLVSSSLRVRAETESGNGEISLKNPQVHCT